MTATINSKDDVGGFIVASGCGSLIPGGCNGGDVELQQKPIGQDGSLILKLGSGTEVMRFDADGKVYVRGELVESNREVYLAFRGWLLNTETEYSPT